MKSNMEGYVENGEYYMPLYGVIRTRNKKVFDVYTKLARTGQLYHVYAYCLELIADGGMKHSSSLTPLDIKIDKIIDILGELTDKTLNLDDVLSKTNQQLNYTTEQVTETSETLNEFKTATLGVFKEEITQILTYISEGKLSGDVVKELMLSGNSLIVNAVDKNEQIQNELSLSKEDLSKYKTEAVAERMEFLDDTAFDDEEEGFLDMVDDLLSNFKS